MISTAFSASVGSKTSVWFLDSGAGRSLTGDKSLFKGSISSDVNARIRFGDGKLLSAEGEGTVVLKSDALSVDSLTLRNVLHVPGADANLLSVNDLAKQLNCSILFTADECIGFRKSRVLWKLPVRDDGVYTLQVRPTLNSTLSTLSAIAQEASMEEGGPSARPSLQELWHRRLGHPSSEALSCLASGMADGLPSPRILKGVNCSCHDCLLGKAKRLPFPDSTRETTAVLQLVHTDLMGPFTPGGPSNEHYVLSMVDDYSGYGECICIQKKSHASIALKSTLVRWLSINQGLAVRTVRSDRGGEFVSTDLNEWFEDMRILHELSIARTPQQNGKAERYNGVVTTKARIMMISSRLPPALWVHAYRTAAYLRNLLPYKNHTATPFEVFTGHKPYLAHLRVFGCNCYVTITTPGGKKLDGKARFGRLVGYCVGSKGWLVWDPNRREVVESRDVVFDEHKFGLATDKHDEQPFELTLAGETVPSSEGVIVSELLDGLPPLGSHTTPQNPTTHEAPNTNRQTPTRTKSDLDAPAVDWVDNPLGVSILNESGRDGSSEPLGQWVGVSGPDVKVNQEVESISSAPLRRSSRIASQKPTHDAFVTLPTDLTYREAVSSSNPDRRKWLGALEDEFHSLMANQTWELVPRRPGMRVIPVKWIFSTKLGPSNQVERYKCRLVAKGFVQRPGLEYDEVFAPVTTRTTLRSLLAVAVSRKLILRQVDVKTAFLNGKLDDHLDLYMQQPEGFEVGENLVCKLQKAIYGLKQAPRAWHKELKRVLTQLGFSPSIADPALFLRKEKDGTLSFVLTYVDDFLFAVSHLSIYDEIIRCMRAAGWVITEMGLPAQFLSLQLSIALHGERVVGVQMHQGAFIDRLIEKFSLPRKPTSKVPIVKDWEKGIYEDGGELADAARYASLVGGLMYLSLCTRPDITFAVNLLARFISCPKAAHWRGALRVLQYLRDTSDYGVYYSESQPIEIVAFSDADYAGDLATRRSTSGYIMMSCGGPVSWQSKRQPTVALSTTEAEYQAMTASSRECVWLQLLFSEMGAPTPTVTMYGDNESAICWTREHRIDARAKHIDVQHHYIRELVEDRRISIEYIPTADQLADPLTKSLTVAVFEKHFAGWGLRRPL